MQQSGAVPQATHADPLGDSSHDHGHCDSSDPEDLEAVLAGAARTAESAPKNAKPREDVETPDEMPPPDIKRMSQI